MSHFLSLALLAGTFWLFRKKEPMAFAGLLLTACSFAFLLSLYELFDFIEATPEGAWPVLRVALALIGLMTAVILTLMRSRRTERK